MNGDLVAVSREDMLRVLPHVMGMAPDLAAAADRLHAAAAAGEPAPTSAEVESLREHLAEAHAARKVAGCCPACGRQSLTLAAAGHVTCMRLGCPRPDAASAVLHDPETMHVVQLGVTGFSVRHPLIERLDDALMDCELDKEIAAGSGLPPFALGRYRVGGPAGSRTWEGLPS